MSDPTDAQFEAVQRAIRLITIFAGRPSPNLNDGVDEITTGLAGDRPELLIAALASLGAKFLQRLSSTTGTTIDNQLRAFGLAAAIYEATPDLKEG